MSSRYIYFELFFAVFIYGCYSQFTLPPIPIRVTFPNQPIKDALFLHNMSLSNFTLRDCTFRPSDGKEICPDPDIKFILYNQKGKQIIKDYKQSDFLRQSIWDDTKTDVFIVHGYAGGDDTLPIAVLRDSYIKQGEYNVWMIDWGRLGQPPCYRAAVNNIKAVSKCSAELLTALRNHGLRTDKMICVGHSLGAHICGLISRNVLFRLHRIVALDPARPLVPANVRLTSADANSVQVMHTNAGHYGEMGKGGHVDFCVNGGRLQPYCETSGFDAQLCSHIWAICYMAESVHKDLSRKAEPCSRRCPTGPRPGHRIGVPILMGHHTPNSASGSYCVQDESIPYCPRYFGDPGDERCCFKTPDYRPADVSTESLSSSSTAKIDV